MGLLCCVSRPNYLWNITYVNQLMIQLIMIKIIIMYIDKKRKSINEKQQQAITI